MKRLRSTPQTAEVGLAPQNLLTGFAVSGIAFMVLELMWYIVDQSLPSEQWGKPSPAGLPSPRGTFSWIVLLAYLAIWSALIQWWAEWRYDLHTESPARSLGVSFVKTLGPFAVLCVPIGIWSHLGLPAPWNGWILILGFISFSGWALNHTLWKEAERQIFGRDQFRPSAKRRSVALVLAITLGWLGVDRFYLGYVGTGVLKAFSCGGFGVWWIVDVVRIARGTMVDVNGRTLE